MPQRLIMLQSKGAVQQNHKIYVSYFWLRLCPRINRYANYDYCEGTRVSASPFRLTFLSVVDYAINPLSLPELNYWFVDDSCHYVKRQTADWPCHNLFK